MAKNVIDDLLTYGKVRRGWLGVYVQPLTRDFIQAYNLKIKEGAVVADVMPNSPAEKAGIKRGDVITKIDGNMIKDPQDLVFQVRKHMVGDKLKIEVVNRSGSKTVTVTLEEIPGQDETPSVEATNLRDSLGIEVSPITPTLKERFGIQKDQGLVVTEVKAGSAAHKVGLREGDLILEANGISVKSIEDLKRALSQSAEVVVLLVWRDGRTFFVSLRI
jgi:serine protease Do